MTDVITTSGTGTGIAPNLKKRREVKDGVAGRKPIAIASGVSAANVVDILPYVDHFLVASSIIHRDDERGGQEHLIPHKVRELAQLIHT